MTSVLIVRMIDRPVREVWWLSRLPTKRIGCKLSRHVSRGFCIRGFRVCIWRVDSEASSNIVDRSYDRTFLKSLIVALLQVQSKCKGGRNSTPVAVKFIVEASKSAEVRRPAATSRRGAPLQTRETIFNWCQDSLRGPPTLVYRFKWTFGKGPTRALLSPV